MKPSDLYDLSLIAARTLIVLIFLVAALRLLGKRQIGQMNVYDLVFIMALSNAVQNAMTKGSGDLAVGFVSAGVLLLAGRLLSALFVRAPRLEERLVGMPAVLINNGKVAVDQMRREHITEEQLLAALRQHGLHTPEQVKMAVLEVDGSISIVPNAGRSVASKDVNADTAPPPY